MTEGESTEGSPWLVGGRFWLGNLSREGLSAPLEQGSDLGPHTCLLWGALGAIRGHTTYQMLGAPPALAMTPKMSPEGRTILLCSLGSPVACPRTRLAPWTAWVRPASKGEVPAATAR